MIRRAQFFDGFCGWIQPEEMRVSLLFGGKINSIRSPADETGIFIKGFRQDLRRSAFCGHDRDSYIRVVVILRSTGLFERNHLSLGRPFGILLRSSLAQDLLNLDL